MTANKTVGKQKTLADACVRLKTVRRRATREQGTALETLGHAVEYLMDSRLFQRDAPTPVDDQAAIHILMQSSRAVFLECREVRSLWQRVRDRVRGSHRRRVEIRAHTTDCG